MTLSDLRTGKDLTATDLTALLAYRVARARAGGDGGVDPVSVQDATFEVRTGKEGDLAVEARVISEDGAEEVLLRARLAAER